MNQKDKKEIRMMFIIMAVIIGFMIFLCYANSKPASPSGIAVAFLCLAVSSMFLFSLIFCFVQKTMNMDVEEEKKDDKNAD